MKINSQLNMFPVLNFSALKTKIHGMTCLDPH